MGLLVPTKLRILVVDADRDRAALVSQALRKADDVVVTLGGGDFAAALGKHEPDVVIVCADVADVTLIAQVSAACRDTAVVVFVGHSDDAFTREAIAAGVSAYVVDGFAPKRVRPVLDVAIARFGAARELRRELDEARTSLAERKIVDRAKGILMRERAMSEDDAYKALRKMAMDQGRKLADVAHSVVSVAELLKR